MIGILKKAKSFWTMPLSRKQQFLTFIINRIYTRIFYAPQLRSCGNRTNVFKPLFWTPENISLGHNVLIFPGSRIETINSYGDKTFSPLIKIGSNVSLQQYCHIIAAGELCIGDNVTISLNVMINDSEHDYRQFGVNVLEQPLTHSPIIISSSCFIGAGARILAGTTLGEHCIVGANAVVKGHFPAGCVIAGIPAKIIKRYDPMTNSWCAVDKNKE
ncbi:acyltransferase [Pectobacterium jejuense]|uniref:acyltransferase n=1 Tax=Pectobacterium jejuense TaxID=2974022 RepID=UPI00196908DD|nr:acyltransferase [Pectobacterium polaris]